MTYLAAQFALYLIGACALGVVIGWSVRARRAPRTGTPRPVIQPVASERPDRQERQPRPSRSQSAVGAPSPEPAPTLLAATEAAPAHVLPPPPPTPAPAPPVPAPPVTTAPTATAPATTAPSGDQDEEVARLRRTLERLQTKLTVLETAAHTSPMAAHDAQQTRLVEQIEQQRHALAAQSMELAVLRARYEGARTELDRLGRVGLGLGHGA